MNRKDLIQKIEEIIRNKDLKNSDEKIIEILYFLKEEKEREEE